MTRREASQTRYTLRRNVCFLIRLHWTGNKYSQLKPFLLTLPNEKDRFKQDIVTKPQDCYVYWNRLLPRNFVYRPLFFTSDSRKVVEKINDWKLQIFKTKFDHRFEPSRVINRLIVQNTRTTRTQTNELAYTPWKDRKKLNANWQSKVSGLIRNMALTIKRIIQENVGHFDFDLKE